MSGVNCRVWPGLGSSLFFSGSALEDYSVCVMGEGVIISERAKT